MQISVKSQLKTIDISLFFVNKNGIFTIGRLCGLSYFDSKALSYHAFHVGIRLLATCYAQLVFKEYSFSRGSN